MTKETAIERLNKLKTTTFCDAEAIAVATKALEAAKDYIDRSSLPKFKVCAECDEWAGDEESGNLRGFCLLDGNQFTNHDFSCDFWGAK